MQAALVLELLLIHTAVEIMTVVSTRSAFRDLTPSCAFVFIGLCGALFCYYDKSIPVESGAGVCLFWALLGIIQRIPGSYSLLVPAAILLPVQNDLVFIACCCFCIAIAVMELRNVLLQNKGVQNLRYELHDAQFQQHIVNRHIARYPLLLDICSDLSNAQEKGHLADLLCHKIMKLIPEAIHASVTIGSVQDYHTLYTLESQDTSFCYAHSHNDEDAHIRYVLSEERLCTIRHGTCVEVLIPLRGDRRQQNLDDEHGVVRIIFPSQGLEDHFITEILVALGRIAGLSLASVRLIESARSLALKDDLTGLFGQHEFLARLEEHVATAQRDQQSVAVIMCDMDHLKNYNDTYGHPAGDMALKHVGHVISETLPDGCIACRYGGEEFAVCITNHTHTKIAKIAEELVSGIRNRKLDNDTFVTASLGWAELQKDEDYRTLLNRADNACYQAKHTGRDRVEVATS